MGNVDSEKHKTEGMKMRVTFEFGHEEYEAYWNEKEYGLNKKRYISVTRVGGTFERKGNYSMETGIFDGYQAGNLDIIKAGAKALNWID